MQDNNIHMQVNYVYMQDNYIYMITYRKWHNIFSQAAKYFHAFQNNMLRCPFRATVDMATNP